MAVMLELSDQELEKTMNNMLRTQMGGKKKKKRQHARTDRITRKILRKTQKESLEIKNTVTETSVFNGLISRLDRPEERISAFVKCPYRFPS